MRFFLTILAISILVSACGGMETVITPTQTQVDSAPSPSPEIEDQYPLPGMNSTLRFEHLGLEDGLSQSVVHAVLQDQFGFLWIGTEDGLNHYDGYKFKTFRPNPDDPNSISDRWITSLYEDSQGYLWIGTRLGGLNRYDPTTGQFTFFFHDPENPNSLSSNRVNTILEDSHGYLWVGTNVGLDQLDRETGRFKHFRIDTDFSTRLTSNNISVLFEDSRGILWVGTSDGGLNRLITQDFGFLGYQHDPTNNKTLSNNGIRAIAEDKVGNIWVATLDGLNRMDMQSGTFIRFKHSKDQPSSLSDNAVLSLLIDRSGVLWVGTNDGLDRYQVETRGFIHYKHENSDPTSLSTNVITTIFEDQGGVLWVGTYGGGVNKYNRGQSKFTYYRHEPQNPNSLSSNFVFSIHADWQGMVWIGTYGGGLNRFDPALGLFTHFRHDPDNPGSLLSDEVTSVFMDSTGTLWVGSNLGLSRLNPGEEEFVHYRREQREPGNLAGTPLYTIFEAPQSAGWLGEGADLTDAPVYTIYEDRFGWLWFGTAEGLNRFNPTTQTLIHFQAGPTQSYNLSSNFVTTVFEDVGDNIWVGTFDGGLNRFDVNSDGFIHYRHDRASPQGLTHNSIMTLYQDSKQRLWVATAGGGLNLYNPENDSFTHYTEKDGLLNNVVYGIVEDDNGYLWLSTNLGISRFDPDTGAFRNYTISDGLQSNEFNMGAFAKDLDGRLYFGGVNGLNVFDPAHINDSTYLPPVVLTNFLQNGRPIPEQPQAELIREVTLGWPNNNFSFEFASLSYAQPDRNQYAYMLENFDKNWNYIHNNREGRYTNLPGGTYTLRLRGSNNDGVWNESTQTVKITVIPPFWETWTFRILIIFSILALVLVVYRLRVRSIEMQNLQLENLVQERTGVLQKRTEELEALYSGDERIIRAMTLDQVFQAIVEVATNMLHADRSVVFAWDDKQTQLIPRVSHGFQPETLKVLHFKKGEGLVWKALETKQPLIVQDVDLKTLKPDVQAAIAAEGIHSLIHLPIMVNEQAIGVFNVGFTSPDAITGDAARLFTALVQRAALSVENMELFEQTKELAVVEERNRVARDLHDSAKQKAFAALAQLGAVNGILKRDPENVWTHLEEAENLVFEVIQELTFLIQEMYPMALKEKGLATTLREYIFEWENRNGVMINLKIQNARRADLEMEQAIYRMIQEALANVARHSQSDKVDVSLVYNKDAIAVTVQDNGLGFDSKRKPAGMGLRIIKERAESIGGQALIESEPGVGTKVMITAPLNGHM